MCASRGMACALLCTARATFKALGFACVCVHADMAHLWLLSITHQGSTCCSCICCCLQHQGCVTNRCTLTSLVLQPTQNINTKPFCPTTSCYTGVLGCLAVVQARIQAYVCTSCACCPFQAAELHSAILLKLNCRCAATSDLSTLHCAHML